MRITERIDNFLSRVSFIGLAFNQWTALRLNTVEFSEEVRRRLAEIRQFWVENPDLRFCQVLISMGIIQNIPGDWYYREDEDILIDQGNWPADVYFWGRNFDKNMNRLPKTEWQPISNLTTDHLHAIIDGGFVERSPKYKQIMLDELAVREEQDYDENEGEEYFDDDDNR